VIGLRNKVTHTERTKKMPENLDKKTFDQLVDKVLDYNRTPRNYLFEYPYRADESREIIAKAEKLVRDILGL
jgi:hypothetical protein